MCMYVPVSLGILYVCYVPTNSINAHSHIDTRLGDSIFDNSGQVITGYI